MRRRERNQDAIAAAFERYLGSDQSAGVHGARRRRIGRQGGRASFEHDITAFRGGTAEASDREHGLKRHDMALIDHGAVCCPQIRVPNRKPPDTAKVMNDRSRRTTRSSINE